MFKKLATIATTIVLTVSTLVAPVSAATLPHTPSKQAATAFVGDLGKYRHAARVLAAASGKGYDLLEVGVVMNDYGDTVLFPDAATDGVPSYARYHAPAHRGQVVGFMETLDGYGEVEDIRYFLVDPNPYKRTDELSIQFKAAWGEWANYAKRRATETNK